MHRLLYSLLFLLSCMSIQKRQARIDPLSDAWAVATQAWSARAGAEGVEVARAGLEAVLKLSPRDMRAMGLLARLEWTLGHQAERTPGALSPLVHYRNSLEQAYTCLQADPGFNATLTATDGWPEASALSTLPPAASPCLIWAVAATLDLSELRGPGADLAVEDVLPLHRRATLLDVADEEGWLSWLSGRIALRHQEPEKARAAFRAALAHAPGNRLFYLTLSSAFPDPPLPPFQPPAPDPLSWENKIFSRYKIAESG